MPRRRFARSKDRKNGFKVYLAAYVQENTNSALEEAFMDLHQAQVNMR
jgi:hypothetical protein